MRYKQNYKEKMEMEKAALIATGLVSERYVGVSSIELQMTYYQRGLDPVLMKRTLSFSPANYACFYLKCMQEGCMNGGYDLTPVVESLAKARKKTSKGKIYCHGTNETVGHASIDYEISIQYDRQGK
jgi:hypothetical protein